MLAVNVSCLVDEMDCGVEQIDGPSRTSSPSCEQRDAGREGEKDADARPRTGDLCRPRIKLPQRSDMICGFASLKGQRIRKFACFVISGIKMWKSVSSLMSEAQHRGFAWTNSCPRQYVWAWFLTHLDDPWFLLWHWGSVPSLLHLSLLQEQQPCGTPKEDLGLSKNSTQHSAVMLETNISQTFWCRWR